MAIAGIIFWGGYESIRGNLTAGEFMGFISALLMAYQPLRAVANLPVLMQEGVAAGMRVFHIIDKETEIVDTPNAPDLEIKKGNISFENVSFAYKKSRHAGPQKHLAGHYRKRHHRLCRTVRAGKSTLLNLVLRFFDTTSGMVKIDEQDIRSSEFEKPARGHRFGHARAFFV